jgi:hypothetical protein
VLGHTVLIMTYGEGRSRDGGGRTSASVACRKTCAGHANLGPRAGCSGKKTDASGSRRYIYATLASGSYEAALLGRFGYVFTTKRDSCRFHLGHEFRPVQVDFLNPSVCLLRDGVPAPVCFGFWVCSTQ